MNNLLIGGAQNTGKTDTIYRLTETLLNGRFTLIVGDFPASPRDFMVVLKGPDLNGNIIRVIINSATDTPKIISKFKIFFNQNGTYDILISSIRDFDFYPRGHFFRIMKINHNNVIEIPLAKITRRGVGFNPSLIWYNEKMDELITNRLSHDPFNI